MSDPRAHVRDLAEAAYARGEPTAWFEEVYQAAEAGTGIVPWDDQRPHPLLTRWLDAHASDFEPGAEVLEFGCGTGDNSAELARRGFTLTAFDIAPTGVAAARKRHPELADRFQVADATALSGAWRARFALVVEIYTLQAVVPEVRERIAANLRRAVAKEGTLLVIARGREADEPEGTLPYPLLRAEVEALAGNGLQLESLDTELLDGTPASRHWVAVFRR